MLKKLLLLTGFIFISTFISVNAFASGPGGTLALTINATAITLTMSSGVYMTATVNNSAADLSTAANIAASHGKANKTYGLDSDGGPLYVYSMAPGTGTAPTAPGATVSSDEFTGVGSWTTE